MSQYLPQNGKLLNHKSSQHGKANISRNVSAVHLDLYCRMYEVTIDVGLMIRFNGLFDTAHDYSSLLHTHTHQCPQSRLHCHCLVAASNSGSQHGPQRKHCSSVAVQLLRSCLLGCPHDHYSGTACQWSLFAEPVLSNSCCIVAYFVVVA
jgi:hypothetical protein